MKANIMLAVTEGALRGTEYPLAGRDIYLIGRGFDCDLQLPYEAEFQTVSRHHCLIGVTPTSIWLRDLGSRNGTYLNGNQIGRPQCWALPDEPLTTACTDHQLRDGDEIRLGGVTFRTSIGAPAEAVPTTVRNGNAAQELCGCE